MLNHLYNLFFTLGLGLHVYVYASIGKPIFLQSLPTFQKV